MHVGIDFGTTNSSVARATPTGVDVLPVSRSILYLEKSSKGILSSTGSAAIARYLSAHAEGLPPGRLIQSLKSYLPVRSLTTTEVFGRPYSLEDLIARILTDLRLAAEAHFGERVTSATVGRPVRFVGAETAEDEQFALTRLREAYTRAGFPQVTFELEPLAAAAAYQATITRPETILIGDFGGGTSDFSVLRVDPTGSREVLATAGLPFAGDAFDARLIRNLVAPALGSNSLARGGKSIPALPAWIYANLERWHYLSFLRTRNVVALVTAGIKRSQEPEKLESLQALIDQDLGYQLHQAVQRTKTALSSADQADFLFTGPEAGTLDLRTQVARTQFEQWIAPELDQIAQTIDEVLSSSNTAPQDIDRVFLTGGTSFVPAVRALFEVRFPNRITTGNEFTSVSQGLALSGLPVEAWGFSPTNILLEKEVAIAPGRSLAGRTILITRPAGQTSQLAQLLESQGATTIQIPTIELAPPASYCALDAALTTLRAYDWLLFTSANAVHAFATRARTLNLPPHPRRVAAIGPATARAITDLKIATAVDLIPAQYTAESFAAALLPHAPGASMLLVRAAVARDVLPEALEAAGAQVTIAEAYRNQIPPQAAADLTRLFTQNPPDAITFTSASTAQNLAALLTQANLTLPATTILASIGPITSQAMRDLALEPTIESPEATIPSLAATISKHFQLS